MNDGPTGTRSPLPATNGSKRVKVLLLAGMLAVLLILPVFSGPSYLLHVLILTFIYIVAAVSFRTITISGQFSISHAGFMGLGAYASGMASKWLGWPTWITVPLAGIVAMFIGSVVAYPFSRLRAMYYAMGSLFCGVALIDIIASGLPDRRLCRAVGHTPAFYLQDILLLFLPGHRAGQRRCAL